MLVLAEAGRLSQPALARLVPGAVAPDAIRGGQAILTPDIKAKHLHCRVLLMGTHEGFIRLLYAGLSAFTLGSLGSRRATSSCRRLVRLVHEPPQALPFIVNDIYSLKGML